MEQLTYPDLSTWEQRQFWFEKQMEDAQHAFANYLVIDHATALLVDLQACYCAGAWIAVIILSVSIIDAQLRKTESMDKRISTAQLLKEYFTGDKINWLKILRNKYVHVNLNSPALRIDDQCFKRIQMKHDAEKAIGMVIHCFFQSPGT